MDELTRAGVKANTFSIDGQQPVLTGEPGKGPSQFIVDKEAVSGINENPSIDNMNDIILDINSASTPDSGFFAETWSGKLTDIFSKQALLKQELDNTALSTVWTADSGTAMEFQMVTRIMQTAQARGSSRDLFYVSSGGFDTHSDADARLVEKFTDMNGAVRDFVKELKALDLWESTVLVEFSEFSRTLDMNSNNGADHAW